MQILFRLRLITLSLFHNDFTEKMTGFANISFIKMCTFYRHYLNFSVTFCVQYRSEISGLRTRKTHAQFLRKRVLKNACLNTRLRAFDACVSFCYSLSSKALFSFFSQQKTVLTNTTENISADKQTADTF